LRCWFDVQQIYVEDERRVGRDTRNASFAVSPIRWNDHLYLAAFLDVFQTFSPAWDHSIQTERERLTSGVRVIELFTVDQRIFVVNHNGIAVFWRVASTFFLYFILQASRRGFYTLLFSKGITVGFAFRFVVFSICFHFGLSSAF